MSTTASTTATPPRQHNPPTPTPAIDRNSAIALSIILLMILVAITWYLRLHFAQKRQSDVERRVQQAERGGGGHCDTASGRVAWNSACRSCDNLCGEGGGGGGRAGSLSRLKEVVVRKCSVGTSSSSSSPSTGTPRRMSTTTTEPHHQACGEPGPEKKKCPSPSHCRTQHAQTSTFGPNTLLFHQHTLPLTSTERPSRTPSSPRRQSREASFESPQMLPLYNPVYPVPARRRSSSFSNGACDKRWWNEVARRGSTTSPARRSEVLEAVPEPEDLRSGAGGGCGVGSEVGVVCREQGRGSVHSSWKGSRCESVIYDWTRPTDAEVHARGEMNFKGVIWDGQQHGGAGSKEKENIQSMDWALKM